MNFHIHFLALLLSVSTFVICYKSKQSLWNQERWHFWRTESLSFHFCTLKKMTEILISLQTLLFLWSWIMTCISWSQHDFLFMILLHDSFESTEIHFALMISHNLFFHLFFCLLRMFFTKCWSFFIFKSSEYEFKWKLFSSQSHTVLTTTLFFFIRWSWEI